MQETAASFNTGGDCGVNLEGSMEEEVEEVEEVGGIVRVEEKGIGTYFVIILGENGLQTSNFRTKREINKAIEGVKPQNIVGIFKGKRLMATPSHSYSIN